MEYLILREVTNKTLEQFEVLPFINKLIYKRRCNYEIFQYMREIYTSILFITNDANKKEKVYILYRIL